MLPEPIAVTLQVIEVLEALSVDYLIGKLGGTILGSPGAQPAVGHD